MDTSNVALIAGSISSTIFATSLVPMLGKAYRTKDMRSYSLTNIVLTNVGNVIHSIYIYSLPAGPIWALHTFYLIAMGLMLVWYLRYTLDARRLIRDVRNTWRLSSRRVTPWIRAAVTLTALRDRLSRNESTSTPVRRPCPS